MRRGKSPRNNRRKISGSENRRLLPLGPYMKPLNIEAFQDRIEAVARARRIFIPHITTSITLAFTIYQQSIKGRSS